MDAGCGTGRDALALLPHVLPGGEVIGVDWSSRALAAAQQLAKHEPGIRFANARLEALPFSDDYFDGARTDRTLVHSPDPDTAIAEAVRVIRPGGRIVISETLLIHAPRSVKPGASRRSSKQVLAFLPYLFHHLRVVDTVIESSDATLRLSKEAAAVMGVEGPTTEVRFVHVAGTVAELD